MAHFDAKELGKVAFATLIPGAGAAAAYAVFVNDKSALDWWNKLRKPKWAPSDLKVYTTVDLLTCLPLGCASYLVYKHGGIDQTDTKLALGAYGANLALAALSIPVMVKCKNVKLMTATTAGLTVSAAAAARLFYQIHPRAGLMLVPYAVWTGFYLLLMGFICYDQSDDTPPKNN